MATGYRQKRTNAAEYSRYTSQEGRDIGPIPRVVDPGRRGIALASLRSYCLTYHEPKFYFPFSRDHECVIERLEDIVKNGGKQAIAMPRSYGKTALIKRAAEWAIINGYRHFVVLVGATAPLASSLMRDIKRTFEQNELMACDFPEICFPIRQLEGITHRCAGQTSEGRNTRIKWTNDQIQLPDVPGSLASGTYLRTVGLTGAIRGLSEATPEGGTMRPDLFLIDDPQTRASAQSVKQTVDRIALIDGDILGCVGPGETLSALMACTVINPRDLASHYLSHRDCPDWAGIRTSMLLSLPSDIARWEEYKRVRDEQGVDAGNEYYASNQETMDAGAEASWAEQFDKNETSATQHAMNIALYRPEAFWAEYQNRPDGLAKQQEANGLTLLLLESKLNHLPQRAIQRTTTKLIIAIDCHDNLLFYEIKAFDETFAGQVIEYGTFPSVNRPYFIASDPTISGLKDMYPGYSPEARLYKAIETLVEQLLNQEYITIDGSSVLRPDLVIIDAGYLPDAVYKYCEHPRYWSLLMPSIGRGIGSKQKPMSEYGGRTGEVSGLNWRISSVIGSPRGRHVIFDANYWKTFIVGRFNTPKGHPFGCWTIHGNDPRRHELYFDHLTAEFGVKTTGRGRELVEWSAKAGKPDNHWLDCSVLTAVGASIRGVSWSAAAAANGIVTKIEQETVIRMSEIQGRVR